MSHELDMMEKPHSRVSVDEVPHLYGTEGVEAVKRGTIDDQADMYRLGKQPVLKVRTKQRPAMSTMKLTVYSEELSFHLNCRFYDDLAVDLGVRTSVSGRGYYHTRSVERWLTGRLQF